MINKYEERLGTCLLYTSTIENLDKRAVGPIYEAVKDWDEPVAIAVLPDHPTPVSYTHLDVYKRQNHYCLISQESVTAASELLETKR